MRALAPKPEGYVEREARPRGDRPRRDGDRGPRRDGDRGPRGPRRDGDRGPRTFTPRNRHNDENKD